MKTAVGFVLLAFAATVACYGYLPDSMPMRWDWHGQPSLFMPKWLGAWIVPVTTALVTTSMLWLLPPKRTSTIVVNAIAGVMCYSCGVTLYASMHPSDPPSNYVFMGLGVFLIVVGNILGKLTWNFFVGIRTYWTLDDPHVWERTHRVAGPVYVLGGIAIFGAGIAHATTSTLLALALATCLYPALYSYFVWRRG